MRAMDRARRPIHEERRVRRLAVLSLQPVHGMCREIFGQVVTRITRRLDRCVIVEQARFVLRRLAAEKPVEVFEAIGDWPMVERPCRAGFVWRSEEHTSELQ